VSITRLEELSLNAWPAHHTLVSDGWVLRLAGGYTRRANSVNPLYAGTEPLEARVAACEAFYAGRGLEVTFKLTPASQPAELDAMLEARGYRREAITSVQTLDLATASLNPTGAVKLFPALSDEWLSAYGRMAQLDEHRAEALRRILEGLALNHRFLLLEQDGGAIGCGLAVLEDGFAGLYDILIHPGYRNQGHGRQVVDNLLAWARDRSAHSAYLNVMVNNAPALRVYEQAGFIERYQYWYRLKRFEDPSDGLQGDG
jgi:N-acetylglutamate synthase